MGGVCHVRLLEDAELCRVFGVIVRTVEAAVTLWVVRTSAYQTKQLPKKQSLPQSEYQYAPLSSNPLHPSNTNKETSTQSKRVLTTMIPSPRVSVATLGCGVHANRPSPPQTTWQGCFDAPVSMMWLVRHCRVRCVNIHLVSDFDGLDVRPESSLAERFDVRCCDHARVSSEPKVCINDVLKINIHFACEFCESELLLQRRFIKHPATSLPHRRRVGC